MRNHLKNNT